MEKLEFERRLNDINRQIKGDRLELAQYLINKFVESFGEYKKEKKGK